MKRSEQISPFSLSIKNENQNWEVQCLPVFLFWALLPKNQTLIMLSILGVKGGSSLDSRELSTIHFRYTPLVTLKRKYTKIFLDPKQTVLMRKLCIYWTTCVATHPEPDAIIMYEKRQCIGSSQWCFLPHGAEKGKKQGRLTYLHSKYWWRVLM